MNKLLIALILTASGALWFFSNQAAATKAELALNQMPTADSLIVVELFTSQGCSSCPPADRVIAELAKHHSDKVLPLSFHVDYWNYIGWQDPYSHEDFTKRQQYYRQTFGRSNIYTPQAVVQGQAEMSGSKRTRLFQTIAEHKPSTGAPALTLKQQGGQLSVQIGEGTGNARISLIEYDPQHTTQILRGENRGETLTNYNIVRSIRDIGQWDGSAQTLKLPLPTEKNIAVLVQSKPQGRILAAAKFQHSPSN